VDVNGYYIQQNAYRGKNIRELCAPINLEMIDTFDQLVAKNFTLYTAPMILVESLYKNISFRETELPHDHKARYEKTLSTKLKYNKEHTQIGGKLRVDFRIIMTRG